MLQKLSGENPLSPIGRSVRPEDQADHTLPFHRQASMGLFLNERNKQLFVTTSTVIALLLLWVVFSPYGLLKYKAVRAELKELNRENSELKAQNDGLREEITKIKKDPKYLEEVARNELGFLKRNELMFQFEVKKGKKKHE